MKTQMYAREGVAFDETVRVRDTDGNDVDLTGFRLSLAMFLNAGSAAEFTLASGVSPGAQGLHVVEGGLRIVIYKETLEGIDDDTGEFVLFGDLLGDAAGGTDYRFIADVRLTTTVPGRDFAGATFQITLDAVSNARLAEIEAAGQAKVDAAQALVDEAEEYRDVAVAAGAALANYRGSKAAGEGAFAAGEFFSYPDGAGGFILAERTADGAGDGGGNSAEIARIPSTAIVNALDSRVVDTEALADANSASAAIGPVSFIEQRITGFAGHGLHADEPLSVSTERFVSAPAGKGAETIEVDTTNMRANSTWVIRYPSGRYYTHTIYAKTATTAAISPPAYEDIDLTTKLARAFWERTHPGTFSFRALAQRAYEKLASLVQAPSVRSIFIDFEEDTPSQRLVPVSGGSIFYAAAENVGAGDSTRPPRFDGRAALISCPSDGSGASTRYFEVAQDGDHQADLIIQCDNATAAFTIAAYDEADRLLGKLETEASSANVAQRYVQLHFRTAGASRIRIEATRKSVVTGSVDLALGLVDAYPVIPLRGSMLARNKLKITVLGDSYATGDTGTTPERGGFIEALEALLPSHVEVVSASVGGSTLYDKRERFFSAVPADTDIVIVMTGANDASDPPSVVFEPNAVEAWVGYAREILSYIASIGAQTIWIGVPALAERDAAWDDDESEPAWELNRRTRVYSRAFRRMLAGCPGKLPDGLPEESTFSWLNQDTASASDSDTAMVINHGLDGSVHLLTREAPDGPFEIVLDATTLMSHTAGSGTVAQHHGIILRNNTTGEFLFANIVSAGAGIGSLSHYSQIRRWTDADTASSELLSTYHTVPPRFLKVTSDGTDIRAFVSEDGEHWTQIGAGADPKEPIASFLEAGSGDLDQIGIGVRGLANNNKSETVVRKFEVTA